MGTAAFQNMTYTAYILYDVVWAGGLRVESNQQASGAIIEAGTVFRFQVRQMVSQWRRWPWQSERCRLYGGKFSASWKDGIYCAILMLDTEASGALE